MRTWPSFRPSRRSLAAATEGAAAASKSTSGGRRPFGPPSWDLWSVGAHDCWVVCEQHASAKGGVVWICQRGRRRFGVFPRVAVCCCPRARPCSSSMQFEALGTRRTSDERSEAERVRGLWLARHRVGREGATKQAIEFCLIEICCPRARATERPRIKQFGAASTVAWGWVVMVGQWPCICGRPRPGPSGDGAREQGGTPKYVFLFFVCFF